MKKLYYLCTLIKKYKIMQENTEKIIYKGYILIDPFTNIPRYVGITRVTPKVRFASHMKQAISEGSKRVNSIKCDWILDVLSKGGMPILKQIYTTDSFEDICQFEIDYIEDYKEEYNRRRYGTIE